MKNPKILCYLNHYYNTKGVFDGKSTNRDSSTRKEIVQKTMNALSKIENCTVKVCGVDGFSLVDLDITFNDLKDTRTLISTTVVEMFNHIEEYDYFINIEDDILINNEVINNTIDFDNMSTLNEIFLPNRLEIDGTKIYCVDTQVCFPGWINTEKYFKERLLKVAINPHSGILIFSKMKFKYAVENNPTFKMKMNTAAEISLAVSKFEKDGPYAHFYKPFTLYRCKEDIQFHSVIHMDKWSPKNNTFLNYFKFSNIRRFVKVIPMRLKFHIEDIL